MPGLDDGLMNRRSPFFRLIALFLAYVMLAGAVWAESRTLDRASASSYSRLLSTIWTRAGMKEFSGRSNSLPDQARGAVSSGYKTTTNFAKLHDNLIALNARSLLANSLGASGVALAPAAPLLGQSASSTTSATVTFFGPHQYVRTTGDPNTYTTTVQVVRTY